MRSKNAGSNGGPGDGRRSRLSREVIIETALRIVDEEGYGALSMRRLGAKLGVDPMAVYYHIPGKSALLDGFVETVMGSIDLSLDDPAQPVEERLRVAAHVYREALLAHPGALPVMAVRPLNTPTALRPVELLLGIYRQTGFSPTDALAAVNIFGRFILGVVLLEVQQLKDAGMVEEEGKTYEALLGSLPPEEFPLMNEVFQSGKFIGLEAEFDRGVRALISGLCSQFGSGRQSRSGGQPGSSRRHYGGGRPGSAAKSGGSGGSGGAGKSGGGHWSNGAGKGEDK